MCSEFPGKKPKLKIWGDEHVLIPPSYLLGVSDQDTRALTSSIPPLVNVSSGCLLKLHRIYFVVPMTKAKFIESHCILSCAPVSPGSH